MSYSFCALGSSRIPSGSQVCKSTRRISPRIRRDSYLSISIFCSEKSAATVLTQYSQLTGGRFGRIANHDKGHFADHFDAGQARGADGAYAERLAEHSDDIRISEGDA